MRHAIADHRYLLHMVTPDVILLSLESGVFLSSWNYFHVLR